MLFKVRKINHYDLHTVDTDSTDSQDMSDSPGLLTGLAWLDLVSLETSQRDQRLWLLSDLVRGRSIPKISAANLTCELGY